MAMIKTDPNQKSTVIVLIVILVGAMIATVVRCLPGPQTKPKMQQAQQQSTTSASPVASVSEADYDPSRNPFQQPVSIKDRVTSALKRLAGPTDEEILAMIGPPEKPVSPWNKQNLVNIEPMKIPQVTVEGSGTGAVPELKPEPVESRKLPEFALLATVKNKEGLCAVIRGSDSKPKVVEVGDMVEGFMVTRLDLDQAVLSDGRDTIVAKRPKA